MFAQRARDNDAYLAFCDLVGGQDELVFDGHRHLRPRPGDASPARAQFAEELLISDLDLGAAAAAPARPARRKRRRRGAPAGSADAARPPARRAPRRARAAGRARSPPPLDPRAEVYGALSLGTRDYVEKNGFKDVVIGLSGGIDSALVAAVAVDALGAERVTGVSMPSRYSSAGSQDDARDLAAAPRHQLLTISDRGRRSTPPRETLAGELRRAASRTSPRRTCRRASGATC